MLLAVPDVRQRKTYDCGPACVKTIDQMHGRRFPLSKYTSELVASPSDGTDPRTIERYLRQLGYGVVSGEMSVESLQFFCRQNLPVIVLLHGHYLIVYRFARRKVCVQDPLDGPRSIKILDFEREWKDHDRVETFKQWGIVAW